MRNLLWMRLQPELAPLRKYFDFVDQDNHLHVLARLHVYAYPILYIYFLV